MGRHRRRLAPSSVVTLVIAGALGVVWSGTTGTQSAWTSAMIGNSTNSGASGSVAVTHAYSSTSCSVTPRVTGTTACTGTLAPAAAATAGGVSGVDSITNDGSLSAARLTSELRATSCAPVRLDNAKTAADPMLPRYATSFGQTNPWGTAGAVGFTGGAAYGSDVVATNTASLLGSSYAVGVWFKVANGYASGGGLIGLASSPVDTASSTGSPLVWMDDTGHVRFSLSGTLGSVATGVSAAAYNDGTWHLAVLSVSASLVSTPTLYVDNATGVSAGGLSALTGATAYWHVGWGDFTGVSNAPSTTHLTGALAGAFVTAAAVSSATRTTLFGTASASAYSTAVLALSGVAHFWTLADSGTTTYAGSLPVVGTTSPCTMVEVGWATTSPSGTVAAAGTRLSSFANGTWHAVAAPAPASTQTSTITATRDASWNSYVAGLRLYTPLEHRLSAAGSWTTTLSWAGSAAVFLS